MGAGVGGLAAAIRIGAAGHDVTVFERSPTAGGKLAAYEREGFRFETGPSLLTLPSVFDDLLALAGMSLPDPVALDPACAYRFADGSGFRARGTLDDTVAEVESFSPGSGAAWREFHDRGRRVWEVSERTFFAGPMDSPGALARRLRSPGDLLAIDPFPSLAGRAARSFADPRLRQWAGRYATYAGSSPYRTPATLACIPFIEQEYGCWYLPGGLATLATALAEAAGKVGVEIRTGADVARLAIRSGRVTGLELAAGGTEDADIVVSDVDADHLYRDLLPHPRRLAQVGRAGRSSSGFVLLLALNGRTSVRTHHSVSFSADYRHEFGQIFDAGVPPDDPTIYVCNASVTDPTAAPEDAESWFVLVNVPAGGRTDWRTAAGPYRERILDVLAERGFDVRGRMRWCEVITPADIEGRYRAAGGAIYGSSSNGRRSVFLRAANRGPVAGLYLVGGSAHPGGGLPLVAIGGRIVAAMVAADQEEAS